MVFWARQTAVTGRTRLGYERGGASIPAHGTGIESGCEAGDDDLVTSIVQQALETAKQALDANALYKLHEAMIGWLDEIRDNHGLPSWRERRQDSDRDPIYTAEQWRDWMLDVWHATIHQLQAEQVFSRKSGKRWNIYASSMRKTLRLIAIAEEVGISGEHCDTYSRRKRARTLHDYLTQSGSKEPSTCC